MRPEYRITNFILPLLCLSFPAIVYSATFTVTNTLGAQSSDPGSLRHAIEMANSTPGLDSIEFNIPGNGPHEISPIVHLPEITEAVVLDGYSQPGAYEASISGPASIKIVIQGEALAYVSDGITLESDGSTIKGLSIVGFSNLQGLGNAAIGINNSHHNVIQGNYLGLDPTGLNWQTNCSGCINDNGNDYGVKILGQSITNVIGGSTIRARNLIAGNLKSDVLLFGQLGAIPFENEIKGNYIGTDYQGTPISLYNFFGITNGRNGIHISGAINTHIGGTSQNNGNIIAGRLVGISATPILPFSLPAGGVIIQGNDFKDNITAIELESVGHIVGGDTIQLGNTIAAAATPFHSPIGIRIDPDVQNNPGLNQIQGNYIGLTRSYRPAPTVPPEIGILVSSSENSIGGENLGNHILAETAGIALIVSPYTLNSPTPINNILAENTVSLNGPSSSLAGIDLNEDGVTINDAGDSDSGPNYLQNYPEIVSARFSSSTNTIELKFDLNNDRVSLVTVELFASNSCGRHGHRFVGKQTYNLKNLYPPRIDYTIRPNPTGIQGRVRAGEYLTATATVNGNTSEFSNCYQIQ